MGAAAITTLAGARLSSAVVPTRFWRSRAATSSARPCFFGRLQVGGFRYWQSSWCGGTSPAGSIGLPVRLLVAGIPLGMYATATMSFARAIDAEFLLAFHAFSSWRRSALGVSPSSEWCGGSPGRSDFLSAARPVSREWNRSSSEDRTGADANLLQSISKDDAATNVRPRCGFARGRRKRPGREVLPALRLAHSDPASADGWRLPGRFAAAVANAGGMGGLGA